MDKPEAIIIICISRIGNTRIFMDHHIACLSRDSCLASPGHITDIPDMPVNPVTDGLIAYNPVPV